MFKWNQGISAEVNGPDTWEHLEKLDWWIWIHDFFLDHYFSSWIPLQTSPLSRSIWQFVGSDGGAGRSWRATAIRPPIAPDIKHSPKTVWTSVGFHHSLSDGILMWSTLISILTLRCGKTKTICGSFSKAETKAEKNHPCVEITSLDTKEIMNLASNVLVKMPLKSCFDGWGPLFRWFINPMN